MICAHRGVSFRLTTAGLWIFDDRASVAWSRYFTANELLSLLSESTSTKEQHNLMCTAIDRMKANTPVYTGDLRLQIA